MKQRRYKAVAGVIAPPVCPTPLGAAIVATAITCPIAVTVFVVNLLLL